MLLKKHIEDFKRDQDEAYRVMNLSMIFGQRELKRSVNELGSLRETPSRPQQEGNQRAKEVSSLKYHQPRGDFDRKEVNWK